MRWLLLLTLALLVFVWTSIEGYSLADTIEYVGLAEHVVHEGPIEAAPNRMRPPAFPLLFAPLFLVQDAVGSVDVRVPMLAARTMQLAISLAFVLATVRLGALLGGRRAGLVAGFLAAVNPVFLRFCVDPLPGLLAGALVAFACERLLVRGSVRRAATGGLLLGGAAIVSYKVLPIAAVLGVLILARDRWRGRKAWAACAGAFAAMLALNVALDRAMYGEWGLSLENYLVYNVTVAGVPILLKLGLKGAATSLFEWAGRYYGVDREVAPAALTERVARHEPESWYLVHLDEMLVFPVLLIAVFALWRCVRRPRWSISILVVTLAAFLVVLSAKHSKSFRLFLPALPLIAATCALGWDGLLAAVPAPLRRPAAAVLVIAVPWLGLVEFYRAFPRIYGNYWEAVEWIDAASAGADRPQRFSSDYTFAVRFRGSPQLEFVRLGYAPTMWPREGAGSAAEDASLGLRVVRELQNLDWLLLCENVLTARPGLLRAVNGSFDLAAAFLGPGHSLAWGPVYVFRRRAAGDRAGTEPGAGGAGGRRLFVLGAGAATAAERLGGPAVAFGDEAAELTWTGFRLERLPGSGLGWLELGLRSDTGLDRDLRLALAAGASGAGEPVFTLEVRPAHGLFPTSLWAPGTLLVDGRVIPLPERAWSSAGELRLLVAAIDVDPETGARLRVPPRADPDLAASGGAVDVGPLAPAGSAMSLREGDFVR